MPTQTQAPEQTDDQVVAEAIAHAHFFEKGAKVVVETKTISVVVNRTAVPNKTFYVIYARLAGNFIAPIAAGNVENRDETVRDWGVALAVEGVIRIAKEAEAVFTLEHVEHDGTSPLSFVVRTARYEKDEAGLPVSLVSYTPFTHDLRRLSPACETFEKAQDKAVAYAVKEQAKRG